jgi:hypothetical protein
MGNRAVITIRDKDKKKEDWDSVYLHWNGGYDSVKPFIDVAKLYGLRCGGDSSYGIARLSQLIGNTLGGTTSLGVGSYKSLDTDNFDNGVYVIDGNWEIVDREFGPGIEQSHFDYDDVVREIREKNDAIFNYKDVKETGEE